MGKGVRIEMDRNRVAARVKGAWDDALPVLTSLVRADCNRYVRVDLGTLRKSSYTATDLLKGVIVWDTPYAKRVYYTGHPSTAINAQASLRWCEKAKSAHGDDWRKQAQKLLRENL